MHRGHAVRLTILITTALVAVMCFGAVLTYQRPSGPGAPLEGIENLYFLAIGALATVIFLCSLLSAAFARTTARAGILQHQITLRFLDERGQPLLGHPLLVETVALRPDLSKVLLPDAQGSVVIAIQTGGTARCSLNLPGRQPLSVTVKTTDDGTELSITRQSPHTVLRRQKEGAPADKLVYFTQTEPAAAILQITASAA
jgi:hypothetical protein